MVVRAWGIALLAAVSSCSSKSSNATGDGGPGGGDGGGSACSTTCAISTPTCGVYESCGQLVDCGMCAFGSSALPYGVNGGISAASAPGGAVEIAYVAADFAIHIARFSAGAWSDEVAVARPEDDMPAGPVLAVAPDGTRWLEYSIDNVAYVTSAAEGGTWSAGVAPGSTGPLAVDGDGTPWVVYASTGGANGIYIASPNGSAWTSAVVYQGNASDPAIAVSGTEPVVAFADNFDGLQLAQRSGSGWTVAAIPDLPTFDPGVPLLAADAAGDIAVVSDIEGSAAVSVLSGTTWTTTQLSLLTEDLLPDEIAVQSAAYDAHGTLWIATGGQAAYLVDVAPEAAPIQRVLQKAGTVVVLPDPVNGVTLVNMGSPIEVLTRTGDVSPAAAMTCADIVTSLCHSACATCITGGPCSWAFATAGDSGNTYGSAVDCAFALTAAMCGDADAAGSALAACETALPTTTCSGPTADCTDGCAVLPSACDAVY